jgi:hypothetical protein
MPASGRPPSLAVRGPKAVACTAVAVAGLAALSACSTSRSSSAAPGTASAAASSPAQPSGPAPAGATAPGQTSPAAAGAPVACPASGAYLTAVRTGRQPATDRVVFEFAGNAPSSYAVTRVSQVVADGSGKPVTIAGQSFLRVTFRGASAVCPPTGHATYPGPASLAPRLPQVQALAAAGDFEGYLSWGIGLATKASYRAYTLTAPYRVVIDVSR